MKKCYEINFTSTNQLPEFNENTDFDSFWMYRMYDEHEKHEALYTADLLSKFYCYMDYKVDIKVIEYDIDKNDITSNPKTIYHKKLEEDYFEYKSQIEQTLTYSLYQFLKQKLPKYSYFIVLLTENRRQEIKYYLAILVHNIDYDNIMGFSMWFKRFRKLFNEPIFFEIVFKKDTTIIEIRTRINHLVDYTTLETFNDYEKRTRTN